MKSWIVLSVLAVSVNLMASQPTTLKCEGVNENKGASAKITFIGSDPSYNFSGNRVFSGKTSKPTECSGTFAKDYKPRTKNPKLDAYTVRFVKDLCPFSDLMISKTLVAEKYGYVNFSIQCGHPGDYCATSYYCHQ